MTSKAKLDELAETIMRSAIVATGGENVDVLVLVHGATGPNGECALEMLTNVCADRVAAHILEGAVAELEQGQGEVVKLAVH